MKERTVDISAGGVSLAGDLAVPPGASGIVLFAHGSGSSRKSPRNRHVAGVLQTNGLATLLMDLLTLEEEELDLQTRQLRFDIPFLAARLIAAIDWLPMFDEAAGLMIGLFGASTGAAAALVAAARRPQDVRAVVSRGGRPDLAGDALRSAAAPTLLIVGGADTQVLDLNRSALNALAAREKQLEIVPGATHLFEEPGAVEEVARMAAQWFCTYLS